MEAARRWEMLLNDRFFQHISTELGMEDENRLLSAIGGNLYLIVNPASIRDVNSRILGDNIRKETIGAQAERFKGQLESLLKKEAEEGQPPAGAPDGLLRFFKDKEFQAYVLQLLDALICRVHVNANLKL